MVCLSHVFISGDQNAVCLFVVTSRCSLGTSGPKLRMCIDSSNNLHVSLSLVCSGVFQDVRGRHYADANGMCGGLCSLSSLSFFISDRVNTNEYKPQKQKLFGVFNKFESRKSANRFWRLQ